MPELETAWTVKQNATEEFARVLEEVAQKAQCEVGALRSYVNAKMRDKLDQKAAEAEQLQFMFDNLGA